MLLPGVPVLEGDVLLVMKRASKFEVVNYPVFMNDLLFIFSLNCRNRLDKKH